MGLADLLGSVAHAALDSLQGQQTAPLRSKRKLKKKGGCTPCQAQKNVDAARKRVEKGYL